MNGRMRNIAAVFLVALTVRIGLAAFVPQRPLIDDAREYDTIAQNIVSHRGFSIVPGIPTPIRAPLYPLFLATVYSVAGHRTMPVRAVQALLDALTAVLTAMIATRLFCNQRAGVVAGFLFAVHPVTSMYTTFVLSEVLFTFLLAAGLYWCMKGWDENTPATVALSGVFIGLATLTRPTTLLLPFFLWGAFLVHGIIRRRQGDNRNRRQAARNLLLLALFSSLTISPWTVRNYVRFHEVIPVATGGGFGTWATGYMVSRHVTWDEASEATHRRIAGQTGEPASANEVHTRLLLDRALMAEGKAMLRDHLTEYAMIMAERLPRFWLTSHSSIFGIDRTVEEYAAAGRYLPIAARTGLLLMQGVLLIFALGGMLRSLWIGGRAGTVLLAAVLAYFCGHIAFDPCPRFHVPAMPYLAVFAVAGALAVNDRLRRAAGRGGDEDTFINRSGL